MPPTLLPARPVSIAETFETIPDTGPDAWTPKRVGRVDDHDLHLVRLKAGEARWRQHFNADEMFLVVGGVMRMHFRDRVEAVAQGAFIIVPAGVEHRPEALSPECQVVLFGRSGATDVAA